MTGVRSWLSRGSSRIAPPVHDRALILAFLYLPLALVARLGVQRQRVHGLAAARRSRCAGSRRRCRTADIPQAFLNSVLAALGATAIALVLGTLASMAVQRYSFFGRDTVSFLLVLADRAARRRDRHRAEHHVPDRVGVEFGLGTIIVGHATFCVVIAYNNVIARLRRLPRTVEDASADLGADPVLTFRRITLPGIRTALLSGGLLAFALSFDEVIVTLFTAGAGTETIPLYVMAAMQRPTALPVVNVVAIVLILFSVVPVWLAQRISGAESRRREAVAGG